MSLMPLITLFAALLASKLSKIQINFIISTTILTLHIINDFVHVVSGQVMLQTHSE